MAINIKDPTTDRLARDLALTTGESITTAVGTALSERLERISGSVPREARKEALTRIAREAAAKPEHDRRSPEQIIDYDETGLPK